MKKNTHFNLDDNNQEDSGGGLSNNWATSYSDMVTLLLVFFILLVSVAKISAEKFETLSKVLKGEVEHEEKPTMQKLLEDLSAIISENGLQKSVDVVYDDEGVLISIKDRILFSSGSAKISGQAENNIQPILKALKELPKIYQFAIEGHTDDVPIFTQDFSSNWELSASRAVSILRVFENNQFNNKRLSVRAFADQRPLVPNRDKFQKPIIQNRQKNRRVAIRVY